MSETFTNTKIGSRLDAFLCEVLPGTGRARAREAIEAGGVRVNGRKGKAGLILNSGDVVEVDEIPQPAVVRPELVREAGGALKFIRILFEDDALLVIEKPRAMHSIVLEKTDPITVADCLSEYCPATTQASKDKRESGLLQRLDFYTSGIMVAAKSSQVWASLHEVFTGIGAPKSYLCLVDGKVRGASFVVNHPLKQSVSGNKMLIADERDNATFAATTEVALVKERYVKSAKTLVSVVRASCLSARRHQVRAHLSSEGYPLTGDELYGSETSLAAVGSEFGFPDAEGFLLHAEMIKFQHPQTGKDLLIRSESELFKRILA